jgi:hypothetical protein
MRRVTHFLRLQVEETLLCAWALAEWLVGTERRIFITAALITCLELAAYYLLLMVLLGTLL